MRNKIGFFVILLLVCLVYLGCKSVKKPQGKILAKINDYVLTVDDFEQEMEHSPYTVSSASGKKDLLELVIRREILIQEAQRQGLDRNQAFMHTIERYWKQTLIKELLKAEMQKLKTTRSEGESADILSEWIEFLREKANITINEKALNNVEGKEGE